MIKPLVHDGWVIVNPYNSVWHREVFETQLGAEKYIESFWGGDKKQMAKFRVVRGKATFEAEPDAV